MTQQEQARKLDELFEAFSVIADTSYVYVCDMKNNYSRWSQNAVDFFNLPGIYMKDAGKIWEEHIHPEDRNFYQKSIDTIFQGQVKSYDMQYRALARDGTYAVCTCRGVVIHNAEGEMEWFAGAIKNHGLMSFLDAVTGLRSLYGFFDDLQIMFCKNQESSVLLVGINNFSNFNDIYGYTFGNHILYKFGKLLKKTFHETGEVYRMDGTKFAVISGELSPQQMGELYKKLKQDHPKLA